MEDIASFAVWLCIGLLLVNVAFSQIGEWNYLKNNGMGTGIKEYNYNGVLSPITSFLDSITATGSNNYVSSTNPSVSQDPMPRTNTVSNGLFTKLASMFYSWRQIADYFAYAVPFGSVVYIFTSFIEIVQMVGLFILMTKIATIARLIVPIGS